MSFADLGRLVVPAYVCAVCGKKGVGMLEHEEAAAPPESGEE